MTPPVLTSARLRELKSVAAKAAAKADGHWKLERPQDELVAFDRHALSHGLFKASAKTVLGMKPAVIVWANSTEGRGFFHEIALVAGDDIEVGDFIVSFDPETLLSLLSQFERQQVAMEAFCNENPPEDPITGKPMTFKQWVRSTARAALIPAETERTDA